MNWYAERGSPCRFEIVSAPLTRQAEDALARRGFAPHAIETFLCADTPLSAPPPGEVQVRKLASDTLDEFASAFLAVYPYEPDTEPAVRECLKAQYDQPGWHCCLANIGGETCGFGAMRVHAGTASLVSCATVPSLRRRGCQISLLARRMADAINLGCDLVFSHAACGSTSQSNRERLGMRAAAPKLRWERLP